MPTALPEIHKSCMGLVLAGGQSTRMGCCKALLKPWGESGPTMLERAYSLVSSVTAACFVSCGQGQIFADFPCIEDAHSQAGPCRGVLAGMEMAEKAGYTSILVLACDITGIMREQLVKLLAIYEKKPEQAAIYKAASGKAEMLAAVYPVAMLGELRLGMAEGEASMYWLVPASRRNFVEYGEEQAELFRNCNTQEDLKRVGRNSNSVAKSG